LATGPGLPEDNCISGKALSSTVKKSARPRIHVTNEKEQTLSIARFVAAPITKGQRSSMQNPEPKLPPRDPNADPLDPGPDPDEPTPQQPTPDGPDPDVVPKVDPETPPPAKMAD
jgi:hypothetical protein